MSETTFKAVLLILGITGVMLIVWGTRLGSIWIVLTGTVLAGIAVALAASPEDPTHGQGWD